MVMDWYFYERYYGLQAVLLIGSGGCASWLAEQVCGGVRCAVVFVQEIKVVGPA